MLYSWACVCACVCVNECIKHFLFPFEPKVSDCVVETLCRNMQNYNMYNDWNWTSAQKAIGLFFFAPLLLFSFCYEYLAWYTKMRTTNVGCFSETKKTPSQQFFCVNRKFCEMYCIFTYVYSTGQLLHSYTSACNKFLAVHDVVSALWVIISSLLIFPPWLISDASWQKGQMQTSI